MLNINLKIKILYFIQSLICNLSNLVQSIKLPLNLTLSPTIFYKILAPVQGFEPQSMVLETTMLPLHQTDI